MSEALAALLKRKELCDKHSVKINRTHVYGTTTEQYFEEIVNALKATDKSTLKQRRENARAQIAEWQDNNGFVLSTKSFNQLVKIMLGG